MSEEKYLEQNKFSDVRPSSTEKLEWNDWSEWENEKRENN